MWRSFGYILLRNKLLFTTSVLLITIFMVYKASHMELSYEFAKILPDDDKTFVDYQKFRKQFGEDGNVMVMGFVDKDLFNVDKFNNWDSTCRELKMINGVNGVLSITNMPQLRFNDSVSKYTLAPVVNDKVRSQAEADSIKGTIYRMPFYEGILYNKETGATLAAITFNKKDLDSERRLDMVKEITAIGEEFGRQNNVTVHYSGMPHIRAQLMTKVSHEMTLFLVLAVLITALILWLFFRSFSIVLYSLVVVIIGVVWAIGIMELFGYKITVLSGLVAPLMMVIGLPNCIFLINKYHSEIIKHGNKVKALVRMIETIGVTLFLANVTTAIGFAVLYFTNSAMLVEFGVVASIGIIVTYAVTLVLIPVILYLLPMPDQKSTKHQNNPLVNRALTVIDYLVHRKRRAIYILTAVITGLSFWGMCFVSMNGYVVDDLPERDPVYEDLHFFEKHFKGVLPFEISIDTKEPNGLFSSNAKALYKINRLQKEFSAYEEFSKPVSAIEAIKYAYQTKKGGHPRFYNMPGVTDLRDLNDYTTGITGEKSALNSFIDSNRQVTRVSYQVADIGSRKMKPLLAELSAKIDSIFDPAVYNVSLTGHSLVFLKSNDYLLSNLFESLIIEILLIAIVGIALFRSVRIIILSKLPCLIPLIITAGVMGFLDIRFKPSTILIFSIAFGISSDGTIYFLSKYRQELIKLKHAPLAISAAIKDTGLSMIYTSIILFCGFSIFAVSSFGGTVALGVLVSLTLLMSMFTNLILLPSILLSIDRRSIKKEFTSEPVLQLDDNIVGGMEEEKS